MATSRRELLAVGARRVLAARLDEAVSLDARRVARRTGADPSPELGGRLAGVAELMADLARVRSGQSVLAAAAGNQALTRALVQRGAAVTAAEAVRFKWPDESFDAVLGFFSVTSHRDPRAVADELKRVARPGAPIVLASWAGQPWARFETAYRHFFGFAELDVTEHELAESGQRYALVFAQRPP